MKLNLIVLHLISGNPVTQPLYFRNYLQFTYVAPDYGKSKLNWNLRVATHFAIL